MMGSRHRRLLFGCCGTSSSCDSTARVLPAKGSLLLVAGGPSGCASRTAWSWLSSGTRWHRSLRLLVAVLREKMEAATVIATPSPFDPSRTLGRRRGDPPDGLAF